MDNTWYCVECGQEMIIDSYGDAYHWDRNFDDIDYHVDDDHLPMVDLGIGPYEVLI